MLLPFSATSKTKSLAVTTTSSTTVALPGQGAVLRVVNIGPNEAYLAIGTGATQTAVVATTTASASATPVLSGTDVVFSIDSSAILNIAAICDTAKSATLLLQVGEGT